MNCWCQRAHCACVHYMKINDRSGSRWETIYHIANGLNTNVTLSSVKSMKWHKQIFMIFLCIFFYFDKINVDAKKCLCFVWFPFLTHFWRWLNWHNEEYIYHISLAELSLHNTQVIKLGLHWKCALTITLRNRKWNLIYCL